jgi:hypothetical protein
LGRAAEAIVLDDLLEYVDEPENSSVEYFTIFVADVLVIEVVNVVWYLAKAIFISVLIIV